MTGKAVAIIAAGGSSTRMNGENKLFADLGGAPVIIRAALAFQKADGIRSIIIAAAAESAEEIKRLCDGHGITKLKAVTDGGASRQESVLNAIDKVDKDTDIIAVHDGARPLISTEHINEIVALAYEKGAVIPAVKVKETIKSVNDGVITSTPDRDGLYAAQTPQAFRLKDYLEAAKFAKDFASQITDDASMLERAGYTVHIADGCERNIKITTPDDLKLARALLQGGASVTDLRIGTGYDVHKFAQGRRLILCGAEIPHDEGLLGHSDADVAVHALMDAMLGALALGDIGQHFPDSDEKYKGISSIELLAHVCALLKGYSVSNADITIIAERPKLAPYILQMRENIARACDICVENVSVKATTEEGLGLAGKGIGAQAVVLIKSS